MEQGYSQPASVPTLSALGHRSEAALDQVVEYAKGLDLSSLCVTLEDEQGRFRIWASNLGALQPADSTKSLDRRLKHATLMRKSVTSGLERLELSAKRALAILNKSAPNRSISGGDASATTELDELLLSIRSAVNHLFGLSMLIRRQRPKGRLPELGELALESSPDISYLTDKFPKAKANLWLARRLGNNITRQRRLIQYRQLHRESLAKRDIKRSGAADTATIVATSFQEENNSSETQHTPQDADSSRISVFSSATSFLSLEDGTTTGRSIPNLSDMVLDGVQLEYGEAFECPYCRTIQNLMNRYEWKRHVFTDLQPYVCTFKDCVTSSISFPTRAEWFQHECTVHRLQWSCNWCSRTDAIFNSAEGLRSHLADTHSGMVTEAQMSLILETCQRPIKSFGLDSCPLCADWEPPSTKENAKSFSRHVARHLQQLALEALPLAIDGLEIRDPSGLPDAESSLDYESNEEAIRSEPTDPRNDPSDGLPSVLIRGVGAQVDPVGGADILEPPLQDRWRKVTEESVLDQTGDETSVVSKTDDSNQMEEAIKGPEAVVAESASNRSEKPNSFDEGFPRDLGQHSPTKAREEKKKGIDHYAAILATDRALDKPKKQLEEIDAEEENHKHKTDKAPIRFKDALGRKFNFPFHLCANWQGMEDLIKQVFMLVDVFGPHVMEGHYDLIAPDGKIILPSVWEKVVQPDMAITMTMWPMDKMPRLPSQSASPPPGPGIVFKLPRPFGHGVPVPPGYQPPPTYGTPNIVPVDPPYVGYSSEDSGSDVAGSSFGKLAKKKKAVPPSSVDQQS